MTEGHPAFVANNGRIGFGYDDYVAFAPETGTPVHLEWVAARRSLSHLSLGADQTEQDLYDGEPAPRRSVPASRRGSASWAWRPRTTSSCRCTPGSGATKSAITFAPDVARRDLVHLGVGEDEHHPQQSIRTFFNASRPERHYVKTALAIQNMGFVRGLSPKYMEATPAINDWVASVVHADDELAGCGFEVLREVAAIGYTGDAFHRLAGTSPYRKMIAALWRESPVPRTAEGEQAEHDGRAAAPRRRRRRARDRVDQGLAGGRGDLGPGLPRRLPAPARALPPRLRPGVHAARGEPAAAAARPRPGGRVHEGHR
ncbi:IucA/IucC family protein [Nocardioides convexus]|uniref:IucA/IucC family protein n=1 Tax=Nocardioides convexus TaxID=2712224 RepID=UPI00241830B7|nr:IucA/IucC family protein [Nocardioides convexus]